MSINNDIWAMMSALTAVFGLLGGVATVYLRLFIGKQILELQVKLLSKLEDDYVTQKSFNEFKERVLSNRTTGRRG